MKECFDWIVHELLRRVNNINAEKGAEEGADRGVREGEVTHESDGRGWEDQWGIPIGRRFSVGRSHHCQHQREGVCRNQYMYT